MLIGVPREIKPDEARVALTPAGTLALTQSGHRVFIETGAGEGSGFEDAEYQQAGAEMVDDKAAMFQQAELVIKVKEPLPPEYELFQPGQILFTYLHLAAEPELTDALLTRGVSAIAYETVQPDTGGLPLLTPMSEVAGRMAPQIAAHFLERHKGGRGILMGGVPGVPPADVTIIGGGVVGTHAAKIAQGLGANVVILDISLERLRQLDEIFQGRVSTLYSNTYHIRQAVERADVVIGAVLIPGARAPNLVTEAMVARMKPGAVVVDVAVDQGGSIETVDRVTTHEEPTYERYGVVHYAVANIPGAVARTSTLALTHATLPYIQRLADHGLQEAAAADPALARGVNTADGYLTYQAVAEAHGYRYTPVEEALAMIS